MIKTTLVVLVLSLLGVAYSQKPFYCQANLPNPSENTNDLTLEMVQILTRHGDRTPLYSTLKSDMSVWDCDLGWFMVSSQNNIPGPASDVNRLFRKVYMPNREYFPGNCSDGQLTSLGYSQHIQLGQALRELYVDKYQLLPTQLTDSNTIWVRSTDVPRTIQSAQAHLTALFPPAPVSNGEGIAVININTMDSYYENMTPNSVLCPELAILLANATSTPEYQEWVKNTTELKQQIMQALDISVFPGWSSFMDLFFATQCHDFPLPAGITQEMVDGAYEAAFWQYSYQLSFPMIARLGMSTFLEEMVENIRNYIDNVDNTKYYLFSGHDDSVGPFTNLFGLMKEWPPYASHVELELWSDSKKNYFLQFKCNGESFTLNGCSDVMCPIDSFFEVAYSILVPDYVDACSNSTSIY
ncbi:hypothetical protein DICPUDRAFT_96769 [Dictyostelium purpureum]|uniref:Counting factor 60 n=1 Tax=Dictyostelium purpureum TaxID=5786 RepID=F0ZB15_DICPU|nr:uncharacterized protein DICPUDRAFT_96769 [Dictyostelium purpureum]EGC38841.1 hypothetical protein DICPUDRAFT_96769 [Dictyostelium purpureum]|eukprot:XP_003284635.1 hypothetical protein DICPUDRAFT_96769 [Dictyostelium purpureum]